jgi:K+-sensing histidine kinase KdpD
MKNNGTSNQSDTSDETMKHERELLHRIILTSVSHDLKTPLASIIGSLETYDLTKKKLSEDKKDILLNTALQEAYRLNGFINNILDMARLEGGAIQLKKEICVMDLLLEDCLMILGRSLSHCTINIKAVPETFPVTTDALLLVRAICIILDNAAKYGTAHPVINIEYEKLDKQVTIRIRDNGPGIHKSRLEDIFSKYERYAVQDHKPAGTGLGLPICREIMRLLGGTVKARNIAGNKGMMFTLTFAD